ncbi:MAG: hypothetical protein A3D16_13640 [Rhodobacterales bacterium RIFCSPHIGHO2_02_FULL_62_130]|nr:MAG: hypothetical protein A3D16_13640 [Rhodobacterales bacterium RIFCSPHIGHO2_02_FULL_62_130]OHC60007.1 MAG: hypothetical protein A3E48_15810 [Rhodobacterales bacterium RIFCSPHIGHO2_12_FULL_62_75]HCZ01768.1 hypothetical protein [Rhodobacter sp.]
MPILLLLLGLSVFGYLWLARRGSSLTRACRWRLDRSLGPSTYRCASCGALCDPGLAHEPRQCLRGR